MRRLALSMLTVAALAAAADARAQTKAESPGSTKDGAEQAEDRAAVLAVVDRFFQAMEAGDVETLAELQLTEGTTVSQWIRADGPAPVRIGTLRELARALGSSERVWQERIWDPTVLVHGPVAVVWAPYDLHLDGEFSHCGVDAFTLFRIDGAWKLAAAAWTAETDGCEPSPLGPVEPPRERR